MQMLREPCPSHQFAVQRDADNVRSQYSLYHLLFLNERHLLRVTQAYVPIHSLPIAVYGNPAQA